MSKSRILITGATGLLGKSATAFFSRHADVYAIVREIPDDAIKGINYIKFDLSSDSWDKNLFPETIDAVVHLAQSEKFRDFPDSAMDVFNVNVRSTANLLDYARRANAKRFIYASSGGVYGTGKNAFVENSPLPPTGKLGYYLGSKLCSEILTEAYSQIMVVGILRFFFMYGKDQKRTMLIPRLVDRIKEGLPISIQGESGLYTNPIHVDDAVRALDKMMGVDCSCTINIGGPDVLSIRDIANIIAAEVGRDAVFESAPGEASNLIGDIGFMRATLTAPKVTLREGIRDLI